MQTENTYVETDLGNIALNPRGEYSSEASYEYLDTVSYMGGSYVCLAELTKTISGIAPAQGKNTDMWQMIASPGDLTPEYIALHDEVINKAKQVETSRAATELSQQEVEAAQADVQQMRQDTQEASQMAIASRDSAAGYAQSAEMSRTAAKESEDNINAQVTGFDAHVAEKTSETESAIVEARQTAVDAVSAKQNDATQAVTDEGDKQIKNVEDAGVEQVGKVKNAGASAVSAAGTAGQTAINAIKTQQTASIKAVADKGTQQVTAVNTAGSTQVSTIETKGADQVKAIKEAGENAFQNISNGVDKGLSEEGKAADAKATGEAISNLTVDLSNKITKFYASNQGEAHITDSDNGKIQNMMLYGKSEQKQYKGINLLPPDTNLSEYVEVSIPKGSLVFWATDGTPSNGGNFRFFNEDKTESMWFGIEPDTISKRVSLTIDAKYVQNLIGKDFDLSKICLGVGNKPIYEPYTGGIPSPNPSYPQEIKSVVNPTVKVCGKNLLPFPYSNTSKTQNGVTFDVQNDGTIHIYGTASAVAYFNFSTNIEWGSASFSNTNEKYKLVGNLFYNASNKILSYVVREGATCDFILKPMVVLKNETDLTYEPYHEQTVTLPYTLNAIPVSSGGNVTINGQQYVADYVDVERGKVIRNILKWYPADVKTAFNNERVWHINISKLGIDGSKISLSNMFKIQNSRYKDVTISGLYIANDGLAASLNMRGMTDEEFKKWLSEKNPEVYSVLTVAEEIPITLEEVSASKQLMTYYPVTNISANSEQLDGYTVFNYPVSMQNGWNYVKQQLNDNRDYIYDMDTKTQDIDTQAAEAYVNSEYAVALTELEV